jgi:hypothetical protein
MFHLVAGRTIVVAACAVAAIALGLPGSAAAETIFRGHTAQDRDMTVRVGDDGLVSKAAIEWRAGCKRPGKRFVNKTVFSGPFDESTPSRFAGEGAYRVRQRHGLRSRVKVEIAGEKISDTEWTGFFEAKVRVRRHGRFLDRCRRREIGWSASL